jgi:hypothetical protein
MTTIGVESANESGALLVCGHDQGHRLAAVLTLVPVVVAEYGVIGGQDRPTAVAENHIHTLVGQHLDDHFRAGHAPACQRMRHGRQFLHRWGHHQSKCLTINTALQ